MAEKFEVTSEPGHEFYVIWKDGGCIVASVNVPVGDWAVYQGIALDWWAVRTNGTKLTPEQAKDLFPDLAAQYKYRR